MAPLKNPPKTQIVGDSTATWLILVRIHDGHGFLPFNYQCNQGALFIVPQSKKKIKKQSRKKLRSKEVKKKKRTVACFTTSSFSSALQKEHFKQTETKSTPCCRSPEQDPKGEFYYLAMAISGHFHYWSLSHSQLCTCMELYSMAAIWLIWLSLGPTINMIIPGSCGP